MKHTFALSIALIILWFSFSGYFSFFPVMPGLISLALIIFMLMLTDVLLGALRYRFTVPLFSLIVYVPWLLWQVLLSNLYVARIALFGRVSPTLISMPNPMATVQGFTILANSITLTPGTFVLYGDSKIFIIHSLRTPSIPKDFNLIMNNRVLLLEKGGR